MIMLSTYALFERTKCISAFVPHFFCDGFCDSNGMKTTRTEKHLAKGCCIIGYICQIVIIPDQGTCAKRGYVMAARLKSATMFYT